MKFSINNIENCKFSNLDSDLAGSQFLNISNSFFLLNSIETSKRLFNRMRFILATFLNISSLFYAVTSLTNHHLYIEFRIRFTSCRSTQNLSLKEYAL